jgi:hypothetical protein
MLPVFSRICPECARLFEQVTASDESLHRTFRGFPESPDLEDRIFAGLAHQRAPGAARRPIWKSWIFVPVFASLLIVFLWGIRPQLQQARLNREVAALLSTPLRSRLIAPIAIDSLNGAPRNWNVRLPFPPS